MKSRRPPYDDVMEEVRRFIWKDQRVSLGFQDGQIHEKDLKPFTLAFQSDYILTSFLLL